MNGFGPDAMRRGSCAVTNQRKKLGKKNGDCALGLGRRGRRFVGFCSGAAFAGSESAVELRCPEGGRGGFAAESSGVGSGAAKAAASGGGVLRVPRGQLKSSARPLGAPAASPLPAAREAVVSPADPPARPPPIKSSGATCIAV